MATAFDTLAFSKRLQQAGMKPPLSDAIASAMQDIAMPQLATKADLREAVHTMTLRMGAMIGGSMALIVAILGALISLK